MAHDYLAPLVVTRGEFRISTDKRELDLAAVHRELARQVWAEGITLERVARAVEHSLCFGLYRGAEQIGFARVLSDFTAFAYLNDVYVLEACRGQGLSLWLMETVLAHPALQGLRRICLSTRDAQGLYRRFGFREFPHPEWWMEIFEPEAYKKG